MELERETLTLITNGEEDFRSYTVKKPLSISREQISENFV